MAVAVTASPAAPQTAHSRQAVSAGGWNLTHTHAHSLPPPPPPPPSPPELCCIDQCEFAEAALVCRNTTQCGEASQCTGNSSTCPAQRQRPDQTLCNNGQNVCVEGDCVGSLCTTVGLEECQCSEEPLRCHICCTLRDQCVSSINSNLGFPGEFIEAGRACSNFQGYCSQEHK